MGPYQKFREHFADYGKGKHELFAARFGFWTFEFISTH